MSGGIIICGKMALRCWIMTDNAGGINDYVWWRQNIELWFKWVRIKTESLKGRHHAHNQAVSLIKPAVMMITDWRTRPPWWWEWWQRRWKKRESSWFRTRMFFASLVILCWKSDKGQDTWTFRHLLPSLAIKCCKSDEGKTLGHLESLEQTDNKWELELRTNRRWVRPSK